MPRYQVSEGDEKRRRDILRLLDCNTEAFPGIDAKLGRYLRDHVSESNHGGWEGFSSRDMTGIWRFLSDFYTYVRLEEAARLEVN